MNKLRLKLATLLLLTFLTGCKSNESDKSEDNSIIVINEINNNKIKVEFVNEELELKKPYIIEQNPSIVATSNVNIRDINGNIIGLLPKGHEMIYYDKKDNTYIVNYYGTLSFINANYVYETKKTQIKGKAEKMAYTTKEIPLIIPSYLNEDNKDKEVLLNQLEYVEIYKEIDNYYLVQTDDYVGYIAKDNLVELTNTFVVIDLSEQNLKVYQDNEMILSTPVVTGKNNYTHKGIFDIYDISYNRYLVGEGYRSYVDVMMKFDGNIGLHDAEYHIDQDGFVHGWRSIEEFGGNTYINNGSHGCVNMPHEKALETEKIVDIGTKVLIKQ